MTPVRLEPAALRSRVKHSTTELPKGVEVFMYVLALPPYQTQHSGVVQGFQERGSYV